MLTIKEPIRLQCAANIISVRDSFGEKLRGNYSLLSTSFTPKELLLLLNTPPEIPEEQGGMTTLVTENNVSVKNGLTVELVSNIVNRILLTQQASFTYQDTVYITSMLNRIGITDVAQFMRQVKQAVQEMGNVSRLTAFYQAYYRQLKQAAQPGGTAEQKGRREREASGEQPPRERYFLHSGIYDRLQTEAIYHTVSRFFTSSFSSENTVDHREMTIAEQSRISEILRLGGLRRQTVDREYGMTLQHVRNHYELGDLLPPPETETQVFSQLAEAALLNIISRTATLFSVRELHNSGVWLKLEQALRQSIDNTVFRFENRYGGTQYQGGDVLLVDESRNMLYEQEYSLLRQLVRKGGQTQNVTRADGDSITQQTLKALSITHRQELGEARPEIPPMLLVQALQEVLFTERAEFAPARVIYGAAEQLAQKIMPLVGGQAEGTADTHAAGTPAPGPKLLLQHDVAQAEETVLLRELYDELDEATQELLERNYQIRQRELLSRQQEMSTQDFEQVLYETLRSSETLSERESEIVRQSERNSRFERSTRELMERLRQARTDRSTDRSEETLAFRELRHTSETSEVERVTEQQEEVLTHTETLREQLERLDRISRATETENTLLREQFDSLEQSTRELLEQNYQTRQRELEQQQREFLATDFEELVTDTLRAEKARHEREVETTRQSTRNDSFESRMREVLETLRQTHIGDVTDRSKEILATQELRHNLEVSDVETVAERREEVLAHTETLREQLERLDRMSRATETESILLREQFDSLEQSTRELLEQNYQTRQRELEQQRREFLATDFEELVTDTLRVEKERHEREVESIRESTRNGRFESRTREVLERLQQTRTEYAREHSNERLLTQQLHHTSESEAVDMLTEEQIQSLTSTKTLREQLEQLDQVARTVETENALLREQFDRLDQSTKELLERSYQTRRQEALSTQEELRFEDVQRILSETIGSVETRQEETRELENRQQTEQASYLERNVKEALESIQQKQAQFVFNQTEENNITEALRYAGETSEHEQTIERGEQVHTKTLREQLDEIDRRNREVLERVQQRRLTETRERQTQARRVDRGRVIDDALRALDNPEEVLNEVLSGPAPQARKLELTPEARILLEQADEPTRRMLESVMRYEADPGASPPALHMSSPGTFNAEIASVKENEAPPPGSAHRRTTPQQEAYLEKSVKEALRHPETMQRDTGAGQYEAAAPELNMRREAWDVPEQYSMPDEREAAQSGTAYGPEGSKYQEELIREAAREVIRYPELQQAQPVAQTYGMDQPHPLRLLHKTEQPFVTEELLEQLDQHHEVVQRAEQTHQTEQTERRERIAMQDMEQTVNRTVERTSEDVTALINRTLAKQLGAISDKVYNQMEKRLRLERARRGR